MMRADTGGQDLSTTANVMAILGLFAVPAIAYAILAYYEIRMARPRR